MKSILLLLFYLFITFSLSKSLVAEEFKHKDFTIIYDSLELKYYASVIKEYLIQSMAKIESTSGLKYNKKILVNLYKNTDSLLEQKKIKNADDIFFRLDSPTTLSIIITPPFGYHSRQPFSLFLEKKLFYILFRQNNLPENVWFEEAFFQIALNEMNSFGLISVPDLKVYFPLNTKILESFKKTVWESARDMQNTEENIKISFEKINFAKTILLYQREELIEKDPIKISQFCRLYIERLKQKKPWTEKINITTNEDFIKKITKKRNLYAKIMENFNTPGSGALQNISQDYIFRMILRLLIKKQSDFAYTLFKSIDITPPTNSYFPELGLFFAKKYKTDQLIWLEYFLLNQKNKNPVDFDNPDQVSILLQETLAKEMPDFQVSDQELDFIRTIQFLIYLGKQELTLEFLSKNNDHLQNIEIKNMIWGLGILLNDKKILKDYDENIEFYKLRTWDVIKAIR